MVADLLFAPFTSRLDPLAVWLPVGLVLLAGVLPRLLHDFGVWNRSFALVMLAAIGLSTLATVKDSVKGLALAMDPASEAVTVAATPLKLTALLEGVVLNPTP